MQPKLNSGTRLVGAADSLIVAPGTFPFSAQALTIHWASCPCRMLASAGCRLTHRVGGVGGGVVAWSASVR